MGVSRLTPRPVFSSGHAASEPRAGPRQNLCVGSGDFCQRQALGLSGEKYTFLIKTHLVQIKGTRKAATHPDMHMDMNLEYN